MKIGCRGLGFVLGGITCLILAISFASLRALADTGDTSPPSAAAESPAVAPEAPPPAPAAESPAVLPEAPAPVTPPTAPAIAPETPAPPPAAAPEVIPPAAPPPAVEQPSKAKVSKMRPIVVTGSLIPSMELITPTPVDVYTSEAIEKTGASTTREFLRQIPSASGNAGFGDSRGNGGNGAGAAAIRNIPGGTLVLINGRRVATFGLNAGTSGSVDINAIPLAAVDRIEVLKDGASAIYGADAVAGVINIILKKDFQGLELYGRVGDTFDTDVFEQDWSFVTGTASDKSSLMVGASYHKNNALFSVDRGISDVNRGNPNDFGFGTSRNGNPGRIGAGQLGTDGIGLIWTGPRGTTPSSANDPGLRDFDATTDRFVFSKFTPTYTPTERWYIFGNGSYNILDDHRLEFFTELSYTHSLWDNQLAGSPIENSLVGPIPADNPFNPFGQQIDDWHYRTVELGPRTDHIVGDVFRAVAGFRGDLPIESWNWEAAGLYSEDDRFEKFDNDVSSTALLAAFASTNPATAFNPFGNRANSRAVLDAIRIAETSRAESKLASWDGVIRGDIVDLPAGPIQAALGGGMHDESVDYQPDLIYQSGDSATGQESHPFSGQRQVESGYIDVRVPLFSSKFSVPLLHSFEVEAAGRYDHYSDFGSTENPKVSGLYQPFENESVTFRASYGTSFQAPAFSALGLTYLNFPDVLVPATSPDGTPYLNAGDFDQLRAGSLYVANPTLKPQTSQNWTFGVVVQPPWVKNLSLSVDYYNLAISKVFFQDAQFIVNHFNPSDIDPLTGNPYITVDAQGNLVSEDVPTLNLAAINTDGLDVGLVYEYPTETCGKFSLTANFTYVLKWDRIPAPNAPTEDFLGDFSDDSALFGAIPRLKGDAGIAWDYNGFTASVTAHYVGDYIDGARVGHHVDEYWSEDAQIGYLFRKSNTKITFGIINIADQQPPVAYAAFADFYARDLYDIRGRMWYFSVDQKF